MILSLFNALNQWRNTRYENHLANMKDQNKCPDCHGVTTLFPRMNLSITRHRMNVRVAMGADYILIGMRAQLKNGAA